MTAAQALLGLVVAGVVVRAGLGVAEERCGLEGLEVEVGERMRRGLEEVVLELWQEEVGAVLGQLKLRWRVGAEEGLESVGEVE